MKKHREAEVSRSSNMLNRVPVPCGEPPGPLSLGAPIRELISSRSPRHVCEGN